MALPAIEGGEYSLTGQTAVASIGFAAIPNVQIFNSGVAAQRSFTAESQHRTQDRGTGKETSQQNSCSWWNGWWPAAVVPQHISEIENFVHGELNYAMGMRGAALWVSHQ